MLMELFPRVITGEVLGTDIEAFEVMLVLVRLALFDQTLDVAASTPIVCF
jgi:hypothetical protein